MAQVITRTLFAGASVMLTAFMVAASAPASAAIADQSAPRAIVKLDDLNLNSAAGRNTLEHRIYSAVDTVCATNESGYQLQEIRCRSAALAQARAAVGRVTGKMVS